ncbi:MAG: hypothetical protein E7374_00100 [Clostridiales bacterium]|nr:hypothetical protein [Clostridiales bacterium]
MLDKKFFHRYNLSMETIFLKAFKEWESQPHISFLRIMKDTLQSYNRWPSEDISREQVLQYILRHTQLSFMMQQTCYAYEIVEEAGLNSSSQRVKNKLRSIKTKIDVDGIEKNTDALQLLKIIRESFAHNTDRETISNWYMDEEFNIHIQSQIRKSTSRHNIKIGFEDLSAFIMLCLSNLTDLEGCVTDLMINGIKIEQKNKKQRVLIPEQISKHVKEINNETGNEENLDERQLQTLSHFFAGKFFHDEDLRKRMASPYRPNFIFKSYPYKFNCFNLVCDLIDAGKALINLSSKYKSLEDLFRTIIDEAKNIPDITNDDMTHVIYFYLGGKFKTVIISNILFSMFSFERLDIIENLFNEPSIDINRIRNSVMHGRYYYNHNDGFDFYDGRNNKDLEYMGTLSVRKILEVAQYIARDYFEEMKNEAKP